jgi:hypothetical protein
VSSSSESGSVDGAGGRATRHPSYRTAIALAVAAAVGGFLFGFDSSVVNGAVDAIRGQFALSAGVTGFTVAIALLGCAFVALLSDALFTTTAGSASQASLFGLAAWRWMFLVAVVPAAVYGLLALRIPETQAVELEDITAVTAKPRRAPV